MPHLEFLLAAKFLVILWIERRRRRRKTWLKTTAAMWLDRTWSAIWVFSLTRNFNETLTKMFTTRFVLFSIYSKLGVEWCKHWIWIRRNLKNCCCYPLVFSPRDFWLAMAVHIQYTKWKECLKRSHMAWKAEKEKKAFHFTFFNNAHARADSKRVSLDESKTNKFIEQVLWEPWAHSMAIASHNNDTCVWSGWLCNFVFFGLLLLMKLFGLESRSSSSVNFAT